jgi:hypothetical protein
MDESDLFKSIDQTGSKLTKNIEDSLTLDCPLGKRIDIVDELMLAKVHLDRAKSSLVVIA